MGRILVEVDIHSGLLETLDIQWRDQLYSQRLDYMGLPFRCTFYHKTGHLRSSCQGFVEEEESENTRLGKVPRCDSPGVDSFARDIFYSLTLDSPNQTTSNTITGKLKASCPFFHSLTSWEKLALDWSSQLAVEPLIPSLSLESYSKVDSPYLEDFPQLPVRDRVPLNPEKVNTPLKEPRYCTLAHDSSSPRTRVLINEVVLNPEGTRVAFEEGGGDQFILLKYRESKPRDYSLGETLDSLVPLLREVDATILLTTYQGINVLTLLGSTKLVGQSGNQIGGTGTSYSWSKGPGFRTSHIKTRSDRKKDNLSVFAPNPDTFSVTNFGALRGMKSLARDKPCYSL
jgi:hypothetical protein